MNSIGTGGQPMQSYFAEIQSVRSTFADMFSPIQLPPIMRRVPFLMTGSPDCGFIRPSSRSSFFQHPEYKGKIALDEPVFTDMRNSKWFYTTEEIIIG